jgi:hypothetical protein
MVLEIGFTVNTARLCFTLIAKTAAQDFSIGHGDQS